MNHNLNNKNFDLFAIKSISHIASTEFMQKSNNKISHNNLYNK